MATSSTTLTVQCTGACGGRCNGEAVSATVQPARTHRLKSGRTRYAGSITVMPCSVLKAQGWGDGPAEVLWDDADTRDRVLCTTCGDTLERCPSLR